MSWRKLNSTRLLFSVELLAKNVSGSIIRVATDANRKKNWYYVFWLVFAEKINHAALAKRRHHNNSILCQNLSNWICQLYNGWKFSTSFKTSDKTVLFEFKSLTAWVAQYTSDT